MYAYGGFIHDVVLESLICGNTQIPASDLRKAIIDMGNRDKPSRRMKFETQFHVWFDYYTVAIYPAVNCTRLMAMGG